MIIKGDDFRSPQLEGSKGKLKLDIEIYTDTNTKHKKQQDSLDQGYLINLAWGPVHENFDPKCGEGEIWLAPEKFTI